MAKADDAVLEATAAPFRARRSIAYVALMGTAAALGSAKYAVIAKLLGAHDLSYYGFVLLVLPFGVYLSNWGSLHALNVQLPIEYGRASPVTGALTERALGFVLMSSAATAALYVAVIEFLPFRDQDAQTALALAGATVLLTTLSEFFILLLRVQRRLVQLGSLSLLRAALGLSLGATGAAIAGYRGLIVCELVALSAVIAIGYKASGTVRIRRPVARELRDLIKMGLPLLLADLVWASRYTYDRVLVAATLVASFGQYTFASLVTVMFGVVFAVMNQALFPQLLYEHGGGLSLGELCRRVRRVVFRITAVGIAGAPVVWVGTSWLGPRLFSGYAAGLEAMRILYLGGILSLFTIYNVVLLAARRFYLALLISVTAAALGLAGGLFVALTQGTLNRFAWIFVASQAVAALGFAAASEREARRQTVKECEEGGPQSSNFVRRSL